MKIVAWGLSAVVCAALQLNCWLAYDASCVFSDTGIPLSRLTMHHFIVILASLTVASVVLHAMAPTRLTAVSSAISLSGLVLYLACCYASFRWPGYNGRSYSFTIPHLILSPLAVAAVVIHALRPAKHTIRLFNICLFGLFLTWSFAFPFWLMARDTEGGMNWVAAGFFLFLVLGLGAPLIRYAYSVCPRRDQKAASIEA